VLTDAAKAVIEQRDRERRERYEGTRPLYDTAYTKGDYLLAEPGCEIWARTEGPNARMTHDGEPRGGIILEITSSTEVDAETGELVQRRSFRTFDYYCGALWRATTVLNEAQVDPESFEAPDWGRIRNTYRRLCHEVGKKHGKRSPADTAEITMVRDAGRLAAIVGQTL
jgi:hypothetical protein